MKTKKIFAAVIAVCVILSALSGTITAFADGGDSAAMKSALETVKGKVDIPEEFTKFTSNSREYKGKISYSFEWTNEDYDKNINVDCDSKGRITYYNFYNDKRAWNSNKLPSMNKKAAEEKAAEFLKKIAPETMSNKQDMFKAAQTDVYNSNAYFVRFERTRNGAPVNGDNAYVELVADGDEVYLSNASISYNYDAVFEKEGEKISDPASAYAEKFPAELVYSKIYNYRDDSEELKLVYRLKNSNAGYISAYTGEAVEEVSDIELYNGISGGGGVTVAEDAEAPMAAKQSRLTEAEISELDTVALLYKTEDAVKYLKGIPQLKLTGDYTVNYSRVYAINDKDGEREGYRLNISLKKDEAYVNAKFDAENKRLLSVNAWSSDNFRSSTSGESKKTEVSAADKAKAEAEIDKFTKLVMGDMAAEFEINEDGYARYGRVSKSYTRMVNGIPYINNTANVTYDVNTGRISNYYVEYEDDAEFVSAENVIDADTAYEYMTKLVPVEERYIKGGDEYKLVYTMNGMPVVDAFDGSNAYEADVDLSDKEYTDIENHWCKEAVTALTEYGIALRGDEFEPDSAITQADLLRLLISGMKSKHYASSSDDDIYRVAYNTNVLDKSERNDNASVTRENAFVIMIRLAGYEDVAKLTNIFKVSYADGDKLSDGLLGYAAILSGMGIVAGDGGKLRPHDNITRAEAAAMLYKYMQ